MWRSVAECGVVLVNEAKCGGVWRSVAIVASLAEYSECGV